MSIRRMEEKLKSHLLFAYNNISLQEDAIIDQELVTEISRHLELLNKYASVTLVLNTRGGNLASGYKIIRLLKEKYSNLNVVIMERCGSTGTFMALAADNLYATPHAMISPTEPQMDTYDGTNSSVSTAVIRNYLKHASEHPGAIAQLDAITFGNYYSTISYFKHLCYNTYDKDRAEKIIKYMLEEVESHQLPLCESDFEKMGILVLKIPSTIADDLFLEHQKIINYLNKKTKTYTRHTIVRSGVKTSVFEKRYDQNKNKIAEGYFMIEEDDFMKNTPVTQNGRVADIMAEEKRASNQPQVYADAAAHHDSYNDSRYHDEYHDRYDDYGDSSTYHDQYEDSIQLDTPKVKRKTTNEVQ